MNDWDSRLGGNMRGMFAEGAREESFSGVK